MRKVLFAVALACAAGCGSSNSHEDPVTAGPGIKIDPSTHSIGVDDSKVPMMPACASGQIVRRGAAGWECSASAPDSAQLGGKPAASYLTGDATAANASGLEGHPASFFLAAAAQAADSAMLGGLPATSYQLAASPSADSLKLGGFDAAAYLKADAVAADSAKLGGALASSYLKSDAVAADSKKLGGFDAARYLKIDAVAADAKNLNGVAAASYVRNDKAATLVGPLTVNSPLNTIVVAGNDNFGGILGNNAAGNLHLDAVPAKGDGRVYLTWASGKGTVFGNGDKAAPKAMAQVDTAGNVSANGHLEVGGEAHVAGDVAAGSFNGLQLFRKNGSNTSCNSVCGDAKGTCVAARITQLAPRGSTPFAARCDGVLPFTIPFDVSCYCAAFE